MSNNKLRESIARSFYKQMTMSEQDRKAHRELSILEEETKADPPTSDSETGIDSVTGKDNSAQPKKMVEDPEETARVREEFAKSAKSLAKNPVLISSLQANEIAMELFEAMKGAAIGAASYNPFKGAGTDEAGIRDAIKKCPTLLDLSKVAFEYEKISGGDSLAAHIKEEMSERYINEFVGKYVRDKVFIKLLGEGGEKEYTHRAWNTWLTENKPKTDEINAEIEAAKDVQSPKSLVGGLTSAAAAAGATAAAGAALTIGAGAKLGAGPALLAAGLTLPAAAAAAVAAGGYYILSSNSVLEDEVAAALDPTAFKKYTKLFEDMESYCRNQSKTYVAMKEEEGPEEGDDPASKKYAPLPFSGLSSPVIKNIQITMNEYCITRGISKDRIAEDGLWPARGETQGRWFKSPKREDRFVEHAIKNHPVWKADASFKTVTEDDYPSWGRISKKVVGTYPGYTPNPKGILAFCIDAYNGDVKYGSVDRGEEGGGGGGGRRRRRKRRDPSPERGRAPRSRKPSTSTSQGLNGPRDVAINIGGLEAENVDTFRDLYGTGSTRLARLLIDRIKNKGMGPVINQTTTITMVCTVRGGKVVNTAKRRGQMGNFRDFEFGTWGGKGSDFGSFIMRMNRRLAADISNVKSFTMNITFPSGKYDQTS